MASVKKFAAAAVYNQLRHNERTLPNSSNPDIDPSQSQENYSLLPDRGLCAYDYFQERKKELYCYNRSDVKVMAGWIVTAPQELPKEQERAFFESTVAFLNHRYGVENALQAIVHQDEGGRPHLHYCFIPVVPDPKHGGEKICANDVLDRRELRNFHPDLQKHLYHAGFSCRVQTGITKEIGGNVSVEELKRAERYIQKRTVQRGATW